MGLHELFRTLRRQVVVVAAAAVIGVSAGGVLAMLTPQRYEASTQLLVSVTAGGEAAAIERAQAGRYAVQAAESYRSVLTSSLVLQPVIDDLGLRLSPAQLAAKVGTRLAEQGAIITATISDANPGQAARIANAIGESFGSVITDRIERRESATSYGIRIITVQPATVPTAPVAPDLPLSLILGGAIGTAAGIGIALPRAILDRRVRTIAEVDQTVDAPVLGGIPLDDESGSRPLVVASDPHDLRAEAYRALRTNVRFLIPPHDAGVFVVTSARPGEGKSTTAANLAIAFATAGHRVALVDADLRKPRMADLFDIEGTVGLSDVLIGRVGVHDVMQRWGGGALFLLPAGSIPPNPAELLGSQAMVQLIDDLGSVFDVVLIDAPPLLPVTDAAVVARRATGVLLVAAAESTTTDDLSAAVDRVRSVDAVVLGTIVTKLSTRGPDKDAYGTRGYGAPVKT